MAPEKKIVRVQRYDSVIQCISHVLQCSEIFRLEIFFYSGGAFNSLEKFYVSNKKLNFSFRSFEVEEEKFCILLYYVSVFIFTLTGVIKSFIMDRLQCAKAG